MRYPLQHINRIGSTVEADWFKELQQYDQTQLTFTNHSRQAEWAKLWAANEGGGFTEGTADFLTGTYPQAIRYNPFNELYYVMNQLAGSIQVFDENGIEKSEILLESEQLIPTASPVDLSVDPNTGDAYVIGSLSDKLYRIDSNLELSGSIALSKRPIDLAVHVFNSSLYICHLLTPQVTVVDLNTFEEADVIATPGICRSIAVHETGEHWAACFPDENQITIYNSSNELISNIASAGEEPIMAAFSEDGDVLHYISRKDKTVHSYDIQLATVTQSKELEGTPDKILPMDQGQLLISTTEPNQLLILNEQFEVLLEQSLERSHHSWEINEEGSLLFLPNPLANEILIIGIGKSAQVITASENYLGVLQDFQYEPVLLKHVKMLYSGNAIAPLVKVGSKSSAGKKTSQLISLSKYKSPQHFSSIYEVMEFKGKVIDGRTFWEVLIPPEQSVTMVLYYQ